MFLIDDDFLVEFCWIIFVLDHLHGGDEPIVVFIGGEDRHRGGGRRMIASPGARPGHSGFS